MQIVGAESIRQRYQEIDTALNRSQLLAKIVPLVGKQGGVEQLLFDRITELPGVALLFDDIQNMLRLQHRLGLIAIRIVQRRAEDFTQQDELLNEVAQFVKLMRGTTIRQEDYLSVLSTFGSYFLIVLSPARRQQHIKQADLDKVTTRVRNAMVNLLSSSRTEKYQGIFCYTGCAMVVEKPRAPIRTVVYTAIEQALRVSVQAEKEASQKIYGAFKQVIRRRSITTVYQPIVNINERQILGYEALTRGPQGQFRAPDLLFQFGYEFGLVKELDAVCLEKAFNILPKLPKSALLFVNVEPESLLSVLAAGSRVVGTLRKVRSEFSRVVLEITEHAAIRDFAFFRRTIQFFKQLGFRVSVDDVGSAHSGLQRIVALKPDFIKVDLALIHHIQDDPVRREIVRMLQEIAKRIGVDLVAEGVETRQQLQVIKELGVQYAEGYLFSPPQPAPGSVDFSHILA